MLLKPFLWDYGNNFSFNSPTARCLVDAQALKALAGLQVTSTFKKTFVQQSHVFGVVLEMEVLLLKGTLHKYEPTLV